jgi:hypothetical protein
MEAFRSLKANLKMQGRACGWCQAALQLGDDAAVCTTCEAEHHQRCWEEKAGCSREGCANTPLRRLDPAPEEAAAWAAAAQMAPDMFACPTCRKAIPVGQPFCSWCGGAASPDGIYHGPTVNAPGAVSSLVFGILGLLVCGVVFGPLAIAKGNEAKRAIAENRTLTGSGLATAGVVLGVVDIVTWVLLLVVRMANMR